MVPTDWQPHRRASDDELVGYLRADDHGVTPLTVFGYPLAAASSRTEAIGVLEARGLACLAEPWWFSPEVGDGFHVLITSAYPDLVSVVRADFGFASHDSERRDLAVPGAAKRLSPRR